jgi:hypothetical protein
MKASSLALAHLADFMRCFVIIWFPTRLDQPRASLGIRHPGRSEAESRDLYGQCFRRFRVTRSRLFGTAVGLRKSGCF